MFKDHKVSVVIPALNEEKSIAKVVTALTQLREDGRPVIDEIIVCDNGSSDATATIALESGARVVFEPKAGYGIACLTAIHVIKQADIILFVDADDSCLVEQSLRLLTGIVNGDDLSIGSRVLGTMEKGALTPVQRFGNLLSANLINILWNHQVTDLGPFRAIKSSALKRLNMQDKAFGWTVEMQVKAIQHQMVMNEYPVDSKVRIGQSKISGTIKGSVMAGIGILSMIFKLRWRQKKILNESAIETTQISK